MALSAADHRLVSKGSKGTSRVRTTACEQWELCAPDSDFVFMTGDLGFMTLEPLRNVLGNRFINAGIAEQNMISVAAGLALEGMNVWVYSIAPFCYARPFEQIRNDICHHSLPVKLVGNGGGYAYGPMGASHHALEDYGSLLTLPTLRAYIPAFSDDLCSLVPRLQEIENPAYLRLGRCEKPAGQDAGKYSPWRKLLPGNGIAIVLVGPIAGEYWKTCLELPEDARPTLWVLSELPVDDLDTIPGELLDQALGRGLCIVEEHTAQGSAGQQLSRLMLTSNVLPRYFWHFHSGGYPSGTYGSQTFHRRESGIVARQVLDKLGFVS